MKKKDKEFAEKYAGQDKIVGRPIRLNRQELKVKEGKDYAELLFISDIHYGYPTANIEKAKAMMDYALENKIYVLLGGDLLEAGLTSSIGDSVYHQKLNPQSQMEEMIEILAPLAKAKLIIGIHRGNHENRIMKNTSIDITKIMAKMLDIPYLSYSCWSLLIVGKQKYSMYSTHGCSASVQEHTKLNAVVKLAKMISADIVSYSHTHGLASDIIIKQYFDRTKNKIVESKQYVCLTGAYMEWDTSYAQEKNYSISKIGSPKAKLFSEKKDVHFSL